MAARRKPGGHGVFLVLRAAYCYLHSHGVIIVLKQEKSTNRKAVQQVVDGIVGDATFPMTVNSLRSLVEEYLAPYWWFDIEKLDEDAQLQAYDMLF